MQILVIHHGSIYPGNSTVNRRVLVRSDISSLGRPEIRMKLSSRVLLKPGSCWWSSVYSSIYSKFRDRGSFLEHFFEGWVCPRAYKSSWLSLASLRSRPPLHNCSHTFGANGAISLAFENCFLLERNPNSTTDDCPAFSGSPPAELKRRG